ncbi:biotin--[acetyl-CoA-carboxylase] ligase [Synechococcus sp. RedBA-s]|uniref:biotin--[acetyl-CoA-carboxylase] ligase n=1 Tax=Synechococcus sp. RedBA-s TaxID=2823741 RepID=UPI0020CDCE25|nr:biotin--[acetyl-CoA-carboxylase] ligase [Synechococcus sp. RedBA-s]MCP9801435.1 biotin--[acetyl-CoA-carboxylase] ligase [Synechococcus sp. RedBA-s]
MIGRIQVARLHEAALLHRSPAASGVPPLPWRLLWWPCCASTEQSLHQALAGGAQPPLALLAGRQRFGHGQRGRPWISPPGGVWLSAALPWPEAPATTAALGLAVAVGLSLQLEALGLAVQLKWPNDLLVDGRKLAGLLPRLSLRGPSIRLARVGVGVNGRNRVPAGAISLLEALARRTRDSDVPALAARVLAALEWAVFRSTSPELVRDLAERRLLVPSEGVTYRQERWQVEGLNVDGALVLRRPGERILLRRSF